MPQTRLKIRIYLLLTVIYVAVALAGLLLLQLLTPGGHPGYYPWINAFFWLCGMTMTYRLDRCRCGRRPERMLNTFLSFRAMKLILSLVLLFVGVRVLGLPRVTFSVAVMGNFIIYSALEIYIYSRFIRMRTEDNQ